MRKKDAERHGFDGSGLEVISVPLAKMKEDPKNPRKHSNDHVAQIASSVQALGMNVPILLDQDYVIIAGTGTRRACLLLGMSRAPAIILSHLSDAQKVAFRIAHNKMCETGDWDPDLLVDNFEFLAESDFEFDLDVTGFEIGEIDVMRLGGSETIKAAAAEAADSPEDVELSALPNRPVSRLGDIFQFGNHRIGCGDARDPKVYAALLRESKAHLCLSDPPYNVPGAHIGGRGKSGPRDFIIGSGELSNADFQQLNGDASRQMAAFSRPGAYNCFFSGWYSMPDMLKGFEAVYPALSHIAIWAKTNGGMGVPWRNAWEGILVYRVKGGRITDNVKLGKYGRNRTDVFRYAGVNVFREGRMDELNAHPTCKPVALLRDLILDVTPIGGFVVDGFMGSGSTIIAAHQAKRVGIGIELDPKYVDVAIKRIERELGIPAMHESGMTFDELAKHRSEEWS